MLKLLVADAHRGNCDWIQDLIRQGYELKITGDGDEVIDNVKDGEFDAILINRVLPDMYGVKVASFIKKIYPNASIFIVSHETTMDLWREVSKVKAQLLPLPLDISRLSILLKQQPIIKKDADLFQTDQIAASVEEEIEAVKNTEDTILINKNDENKESECEAIEVPELPKRPNSNLTKKQKRESNEGQVILIYSWKGGVGKTTTAVNLATILQTYGDMSVGLVEMTRQAGNILSHFSLIPTVTIQTWVNERPNEKNALSRMLEDPATGMYILPSQTLLDYSKNPTKITIRDALQMIRTLRQVLDVIVIDAGTLLDDFQFALLQEADHIVLMSDLSFETLKENHYMPEIFRRNQLDIEKVIHVINRVEKGLGVSVKDATEIVLVPFTKTLPFRKNIMKKKDNKEPFVLSHDSDPYTTELKNLLAELFNGNEKLQSKQSWLKKVMKKFVG